MRQFVTCNLQLVRKRDDGCRGVVLVLGRVFVVLLLIVTPFFLTAMCGDGCGGGEVCCGTRKCFGEESEGKR